jgi:hypothetical protein
MPYYHIAITKKTGRERWAFAFNMSLEGIMKEIITPLQQQTRFMCGKSVILPIDIEKIAISKTEELAPAILKKTRPMRFFKKFAGGLGSPSEEDEYIDQWTVIRAGKDVTRELLRGFGISEAPTTGAEERSKPEVTKDELKNYLKEFLKSYRAEVKNKYPAYFNEFPFYSALRAIGVISLHYVYTFFTRDGNPKATSIDVFDENDIPELVKVKDAISMKEQDILVLLGVKSYIPDLVHCFWQEHHYGLRLSFIGPSISKAVDESIKNHYSYYVETERDPTMAISGEYRTSVISRYTFVCNTMDDTALSNKIEEIMDKTEGGEVLVAGWIDSAGMRLLGSLTKRNVKFRVITHRPSASEKMQSPSDISSVFSKLAKEHTENIRVLPQLHTRLLISDKEALVSTADLTKDSLGVKYEAGISTTDGLAIMKMKEFFEKLWETSTKLSASRTSARTKEEPINKRIIDPREPSAHSPVPDDYVKKPKS